MAAEAFEQLASRLDQGSEPLRRQGTRDKRLVPQVLVLRVGPPLEAKCPASLLVQEEQRAFHQSGPL